MNITYAREDEEGNAFDHEVYCIYEPPDRSVGDPGGWVVDEIDGEGIGRSNRPDWLDDHEDAIFEQCEEGGDDFGRDDYGRPCRGGR